MQSEKVEGAPCNKCGSTIRYQHITNNANEGKCVQCSSDQAEARRKKHFACATLSEGIEPPYREIYMKGYNAHQNTTNQYPVSEIGKRCAWAAGHNDKWSGA